MNGRVMIAGTGSGCGKTTVTCALLAALVKSGGAAVSFKCGPDYIDPMFHKKVTGVDSRNLDVFLMGEGGVKAAVARREGRGLAVIEGVMGLYDGQGGGSFASANHISGLTETPAVLVVSVKGASLSVCATVKGFMEFEPNRIRGVILNGVAEGRFPFYRQMIEGRLGVRVIGFLPSAPEAAIGSRHLGLITADEVEGLRGKLDILGGLAMKHIDMEALRAIAGEAGRVTCGQEPPAPAAGRAVRLYVARDGAFSFFYEDNHDIFRVLGAEVIFFSPLRDAELPADADGLVLWGGYPELYAGELAANAGMRQSIRRAVQGGLPVYAECGGFMYMRESLTDPGGETYEMLGLLPGGSRMAESLQNFGYYEMTARRGNMLCAAGDKINAHFFHRYITEGGGEGDCFTAAKQNGAGFDCVVAGGNIFAGFQHLHFAGKPAFAQSFIKACAAYGGGK